MGRNILLARPHPFLVSQMRPLLEECGFDMRVPANTADIPSSAITSSGAVVSLAISSAVPASIEDVYSTVRAVAPRIPILFASLPSFAQTQAALSRLARQVAANPSIHAAGGMEDRDRSLLGRVDTWLHVAKDDLNDPQRWEKALADIGRHFV